MFDKSYNTMISYPTFFRIINNLDENIKQNSIKSVKKDRIYSYGIIQKVVPIPFFDSKNKIFYLTIFYSKQDYRIINFIFEEKKRELIKLFNFIRESIIIEGEYPKEISIDDKIIGSTKNILRKVFFETKIDLYQEEADTNMLSYVGHINDDLLKEFGNNKPSNLEEVIFFIKKYFFIVDVKDNIEDINIDIEKLRYFLNRYKRKVYKEEVRVKNSIYTCKILKDFEGEIVDIFYNEFLVEKIDIYLKEKFLGAAKIK